MSRLQTFAGEVAAILDDSTVLMVYEKKEDGTNRRRRKVKWYHSGGRLERVSQAGGRLSDSNGNRTVAVWQRVADIEAKVSAENVDTLETLMDNLVSACEQARPNGSVEMERYDWVYSEIGQRTPEATIFMSLILPIADEIKALTEITDEEENCEFAT
jgi:hypothetical protein